MALDVASVLCELHRELRGVRLAAQTVDDLECLQAAQGLQNAERDLCNLAATAISLGQKPKPRAAPGPAAKPRWGTTGRGRSEPPARARPKLGMTAPRQPVGPQTIGDPYPAVPRSQLALGVQSLQERRLLPPQHDATLALAPALAVGAATRAQSPPKVHIGRTPVLERSTGAQSPRRAESAPRKILTNAGFFSSMGRTYVPEPVPRPPPAPAKRRPDVDLHAFHQLELVRGRVDPKSPPYRSYERTYAEGFADIRQSLNRLEELCQRFRVQHVVVDGYRLARLLGPSDVELLECLPEDRRKEFKVPGLRFRTNGRENAVTYISACWKRRRELLRFAYLKERGRSARTIQQGWRALLTLQSTRGQIEALRRARQEKFEALQQMPLDPAQRQIEVHLGSLSLLPEEFRRRSGPGDVAARQRQIQRLFRLLDSEVDVIYVSPEPLHEDMLEYYVKLLQFRGVRNPPRRLQVVAPENGHLCPGASLTSHLLWSPKALGRVKTLVAGRRAAVVAHAPSHLEVELCAYLGCPLLGARPELCSKANGLRLVTMAGLSQPLSAVDLRTADEFYSALAELLVQHPEVPMWAFKLEGEVGGRGVGTIELTSLKMVQDVRKKQLERRQQSASEDQELLDKQDKMQVQHVLEKHLGKKVLMRSQSGWSFKDFLSLLPLGGGIIQAVAKGCRQPTVHFRVQPLSTQVLATTQALHGFGPLHRFPAKEKDHEVLTEVATRLGDALRQKGILGFCSADCAVFDNPEHDPASPGDASPLEPDGSGPERLQVVDVDLHLTEVAQAAHALLFVSEATFEEGRFEVASAPAGQGQRVGLISTALEVSLPATYTDLFGLFRQAEKSFDLVANAGTVLLHADLVAKRVALAAVATTDALARLELSTSLGLFEKPDTFVRDLVANLRGSASKRQTPAPAHR